MRPSPAPSPSPAGLPSESRHERPGLVCHLAWPMLALALSGCGMSTFRPYREPTSGPVARLRVSTASGYVRVHAGTRCPDWSSPRTGLAAVQEVMMSSGNNGKSLGMPGTAPAGFVSSEVVVQANEPLLLTFTSTKGRLACNLNYAFTPQPGRDYVAVFNQTPDGYRCGRAVNFLSDSGAVLVRSPSDEYSESDCKDQEKERKATANAAAARGAEAP